MTQHLRTLPDVKPEYTKEQWYYRIAKEIKRTTYWHPKVSGLAERWGSYARREVEYGRVPCNYDEYLAFDGDTLDSLDNLWG